MSSSVQQIPRTALDTFSVLGTGGFSTVYKVRYRQEDICEKCRSTYLKCSNVAVKKLYTVDRKELEVLSKLEHPYVIKLIGVVDEIPEYYLVLELCEGGSLRTYLNKHTDKPLEPPRAFAWIEQGAIALQYLDEQNVIHRDLKADNFLISRTRNLKLCDFGISRNAERTVTVSSLKGTFGWTAPECFEDQEHVSPLSDIYSFGTVIWEILTRLIPFEKCEYQHVMYRVCIAGERPMIPDDFHPLVVELLTKCWNAERKERPSIGEVVEKVSDIRKQIQNDSKCDDKTLADCMPYTCAKIEVYEFSNQRKMQEKVELSKTRRPGTSRRIPTRENSPTRSILVPQRGLPQALNMLNTCVCTCRLQEEENSEGVVKLDKRKPFYLHHLVQRNALGSLTDEPASSGNTSDEESSNPQHFLWIPYGSSVADIKRMMDKDMPLDRLHLFTSATKSKELSDGETLLDHKMCSERAILHLEVNADVIITRADNIAGEILSVFHHEDITAVKEKIQKKLEFPPETQQLLCNGKTLYNPDVIAQFLDDKFKATLQLVCHKAITICLDVSGRYIPGPKVKRRKAHFKEQTPGKDKVSNKKGKDAASSSTYMTIFPSQTVEELVQSLQRRCKLEAVLFNGKLLYSSSCSYGCLRPLQKHLLLEEQIQSGDTLIDEDPIEVRIRPFNKGSDYSAYEPLSYTTVTRRSRHTRKRRQDRELLWTPRGGDLFVYPSQKISDVKHVIQHEMSHLVNAQKNIRLSYEAMELNTAMELNNDHSVSQSGIKDGSKVIVEKQIKVSVHVKAESDTVIGVSIWESDTIAQLKKVAGILPTSASGRYMVHIPRAGYRHEGAWPIDVGETDTVMKVVNEEAKLWLLDEKYYLRIKLILIELGGDCKDVAATPSSTIQELLCSVVNSSNIRVRKQGKEVELEKDRTLASYNISNRTVLEVYFHKPRGDLWVQCGRCQKYRKLPPTARMRLKEWFCEMNPDPSHSHCSLQEETQVSTKAMCETLKKHLDDQPRLLQNVEAMDEEDDDIQIIEDDDD